VTAVGSAIVLGISGNRHVHTNVQDGTLYGKRAAANESSARFHVEMHSLPLLGKPVLVVLKNVETGKYVSRTRVHLKSNRKKETKDNKAESAMEMVTVMEMEMEKAMEKVMGKAVVMVMVTVMEMEMEKAMEKVMGKAVVMVMVTVMEMEMVKGKEMVVEKVATKVETEKAI
jgi:hypothetical protein